MTTTETTTRTVRELYASVLTNLARLATWPDEKLEEVAHDLEEIDLQLQLIADDDAEVLSDTEEPSGAAWGEVRVVEAESQRQGVSEHDITEEDLGPVINPGGEA